MDIQNIIDTTVLTVIGTIITVSFRYAVPVAVDFILRAKANHLVKAAESIYSGQGLGDAKYQSVADGLVTFAAKYHVKLDSDRVEKYIKAAVTDLHAAFNSAVTQVNNQVSSADQATQPQEPAK